MPTSSGTSKRDEVGELSKALRALSSKQSDDDRANAQRRSLFRRVLNLVTVNVDASSLFPDVVVNAHTVDVACKKMLYHCLLYTSPSPRDAHESRMPSSA